MPAYFFEVVSWFLPFVFPTKILYTFHIFHIHATCPQTSLLDLVKLIIFDEGYK